MSSDRGAGEEEGRRREERRARPVSLVRTMSVTVDSGLAGEIFDHFCNAATLKSILRSFRCLSIPSFRPLYNSHTQVLV